MYVKLLGSVLSTYIPDPGSESMHSTPHPLKQHFCVPGHELSFPHSAIQIPTVPAGMVGHMPGFSTEYKVTRHLTIKSFSNIDKYKIPWFNRHY